MSMTSPWGGKFAKMIASEKRSRKFWNFFWGILLALIILCMSPSYYMIACDHVKYETEQVYVECKDGYLITKTQSVKIPRDKEHEVTIDKLMTTVDTGETITLVFSKVNDKLLEVRYLDETVFKIVPISLKVNIIANLILVLPMILLISFILILVNLKNPGKRLRKIRSKFLEEKF